MKRWEIVSKRDPLACALADRHYSRRQHGATQFMPPGQTLVLLTSDARAVFGWWRPHPASGLQAMNKRDGWTCTIFRNEGAGLSSELILEAEPDPARAPRLRPRRAHDVCVGSKNSVDESGLLFPSRRLSTHRSIGGRSKDTTSEARENPLTRGAIVTGWDYRIVGCESCGWTSPAETPEQAKARGVPTYCEDCGGRARYVLEFAAGEERQALELARRFAARAARVVE